MSNKEHGQQCNLRWSAGLDQLFVDAKKHPTKPRTFNKIVSQAIRRCLPLPNDEYRSISSNGTGRNIELKQRLHDRIKRTKTAALDDSDASVNSIMVEALCRYFFFRSVDFEFSPDVIKKETGYSAASAPKQHHHDVVRDVENALEKKPHVDDLSKEVEMLLDSDDPESPNSLNQLMAQLDPTFVAKAVDEWVKILKKHFNEQAPKMAKSLSKRSRGAKHA